MKIEGLVTRSTGSWYDVRLDDGRDLACRIRGRFKLQGFKLTNPVAVGDRVRVSIDGEDANIIEILPRTNYVVRQSPRQKHHLHLLAANIDQAFVVVTIREPGLKPGFIDRFLLMTEPYDIPTHIVFNKADLLGEDDLELYAALEYIYGKIGYRAYLVSALTGQGLDDISSQLHGRTSLISGQSGVGKSSLLNTLMPHLGISTQVLSDSSGKGQHTTTFAQMHFMDESTAVVDTPGIKTLSFNNLEVLDVAHNFREFFELSVDCQFSNCTHREEPKCAVKRALDAQEISPLRYQHYLTIIDEIEGQNYWERHKG